MTARTTGETLTEALASLGLGHMPSFFYDDSHDIFVIETDEWVTMCDSAGGWALVHERRGDEADG